MLGSRRKVRCHSSFLAGWFVILGTFCAQAQAVVDTVYETFDGTAMDMTRWQQFTHRGGTITQDYALTLSAPASGSWADYTSRQLRIGVGGHVRVTVTGLAGPSEAGLILTNDSSGTTEPVMFDTRSVGLVFYPSGTTFEGLYSATSGLGHTYTPPIATVSQMLNVPYTIGIERTSLTSARMEVFTEPGLHLGTRNVTFSEMPAYMYVSLYGYWSSARFDNIAIGGNWIPEPALSWLAATLPLVGVRRRRRRTEPAVAARTFNT
jgi:hypothetical protein